MNILNCNDKEIPENYHGFIYKTIFPNGKIYIGQTTKRVEQIYFGSGTKVYSFVESKGTIGIKREILIFCKNQIILNKFEEIFINKLNSTNHKIGYNIIKGSVSKFNPMKNPDSVEKLRKYVIQNHPMRGIRHSEEYKQNMSDILKKREFSGENNPMFGKKSHNRNKMCVNDGTKNKFISAEDSIPDGYFKGMIFRSKLKSL